MSWFQRVSRRRELPCVLIFDNNDLRTPFRQIAVYVNGRPLQLSEPSPSRLKPIL